MISLDEFLPDFQAHVDGLSRSLALTMLRASCHTFCVESQADTTAFSAIPVVIGQGKYTIPAPEGKRVVVVREVFHDGREVHARSRYWLNDNAAGWQDSEGPAALFYCGDSAGTIIVSPKPSKAGSLTGVASYCPAPKVTAVADLLFNDYRYAIVDGALSNLLRMSNRDWSDRKQAAEREASFYSAIAEAKARSMSQFSPANIIANNMTFGV